MNLQTNQEIILAIRDMSERYVQDQRLTNAVLNNDDFITCSGSGNPKHHHYGDHGLLVHTYEVILTAMSVCNAYYQLILDREEIFLSALYHDTGKLKCYHKENGVWKYTKLNDLVHHIPFSVMYWMDSCRWAPTKSSLMDNVMHNIVAHHGSREHGSNVSPKTKEAWIVHCADKLSARLNDYETYDKK